MPVELGSAPRGLQRISMSQSSAIPVAVRPGLTLVGVWRTEGDGMPAMGPLFVVREIDVKIIRRVDRNRVTEKV